MQSVYLVDCRVYIFNNYISLINKIIKIFRVSLNIYSFSIKLARKIILYSDVHPRIGVGCFNLLFHSSLKLQWL